MQDDYNKRIEDLLEENLAFAKENNRLLEKMRKGQRFAFWMKVLYFFLVTGLLFGSFYFIAPYIKKTTEIYNKVSNPVQDISNYLNDNIKDFIPGKSEKAE